MGATAASAAPACWLIIHHAICTSENHCVAYDKLATANIIAHLMQHVAYTLVHYNSMLHVTARLTIAAEFSRRLEF